MKPIATSNYDFEGLITGGYVYVDKTDMFYRLAKRDKDAIYFISRPRRFGKSLMLSTFKCLFEGKKKLFKGLKIEKKWDWSKTYPVISLNMRKTSAPSIEALEKNLWKVARDVAKENGLSVRWSECGSSGSAFSDTLEAMAKKHGQFVLLIDEYDVPLQTFLRTGKIGAARAIMHDFYGGIKDNVGAIRFLMMTGVSKFTKLSVFSALNNLTDLTMDRPEFAGMLGYTRKEIETTLAPQLSAFARKLRCTREEALRRLLAWYDSYRFSPYSNVKVLNPVSVGQALPSGILTDYWSKTGVPTLVVERLQAGGKMPSDLAEVKTTPGDLDVCDAEDLPWVSLLYQSGYLTIKKVVWTDDPNGRYVSGLVLGVPNMEVRENLKSNFWRTVMHMDESSFSSLVDAAKRQLAEGDVRMLVGKTIYSLYAAIPSTWAVKSEAEAKRYFQLLMKMLGASVQAEEASAFGYADAIVETKKAVYVFEFKFNKSAKAAMRQIREKGYADAYKADKRPVTLIGINFSSKKRNIDEPLIELMQGIRSGDC